MAAVKTPAVARSNGARLKKPVRREVSDRAVLPAMVLRTTEEARPLQAVAMSLSLTRKGYGEARFGDNIGTPGSAPELAVGTSSTLLGWGDVLWDSNLQDGLNSSQCSATFTAAPNGSGGTKLTWTVKGKTLTHTAPGTGPITWVEIVAGVRAAAAVKWTSCSVAFGSSTASAISGPSVDTRDTGLPAMAVSSVGPRSGTPNKVTVKGSIQFLARAPVWLAPDDVFAQVIVYY
jgi:hypothetical protein